MPAHSGSSLNFGEAIAKQLDWIKRNNRVFELSKSEFIEYIKNRIPPKPPNYETIVKINKGELYMTEVEIVELEFGANRCVVPSS